MDTINAQVAEQSEYTGKIEKIGKEMMKYLEDSLLLKLTEYRLPKLRSVLNSLKNVNSGPMQKASALRPLLLLERNFLTAERVQENTVRDFSGSLDELISLVESAEPDSEKLVEECVKASLATLLECSNLTKLRGIRSGKILSIRSKLFVQSNTISATDDEEISEFFWGIVSRVSNVAEGKFSGSRERLSALALRIYKIHSFYEVDLDRSSLYRKFDGTRPRADVEVASASFSQAECARVLEPFVSAALGESAYDTSNTWELLASIIAIKGQFDANLPVAGYEPSQHLKQLADSKSTARN